VKEGVERILITNRNHTRAANRVRERTGASVEIHASDADYARHQGVGIDDTLEVTQRVGPFTVVGMPGKSPGEIALHDPLRQLLVVGDALIGHPAGRLTLLPDRVVEIQRACAPACAGCSIRHRCVDSAMAPDLAERRGLTGADPHPPRR
jgi:hypothetical protein